MLFALEENCNLESVRVVRDGTLTLLLLLSREVFLKFELNTLNCYSFIFLFITVLFLVAKRKGFFCLCISHLVKSERTPSNDVMLILSNEIKEKKNKKKTKGK